MLRLWGFFNKEVTNIWSEVAVSQTKQEGISVLLQYLLTGMES